MVTYLTSAGNELMNDVIGDEAVLNFTKIQFGNGTDWLTEDETELRKQIATSTALHNPIASKEIAFDNQDGSVTIDPETGLALLEASFQNINDTTGFHVTEVGIFAQKGDDDSTEILYAVSAVDVSQAGWVPPNTESVATFTYSIYVYVGDVADVTAVMTVNADKASQADLDNHKNRRDNPHEVTKKQAGLEHVPNVNTHNQRPAFTIANTLANIDGTEQSGSDDEDQWYGKETLGTILGKIQKAIAEFILHRSDYNNPHKTTAAQVGAAAVKHYHDASSDFNKGVLPTIRGGTGTNKGHSFNANSGGCKGYAYLMGDPQDKNKLLMQWGRINVDGNTADVTFLKEYEDADYALAFPTCGDEFVPVWRNPTKRSTGFTMNRTFGIDSSGLKTMLKWVASGVTIFTPSKKDELHRFIDEHIGASQTADWIAIGKAKE